MYIGYIAHMDTIPVIFAAYAHESCYPPHLEARGSAEYI